jgi:hypothetical protein
MELSRVLNKMSLPHPVRTVFHYHLHAFQAVKDL